MEEERQSDVDRSVRPKTLGLEPFDDLLDFLEGESWMFGSEVEELPSFGTVEVDGVLCFVRSVKVSGRVRLQEMSRVGTRRRTFWNSCSGRLGERMEDRGSEVSRGR